MILGYVIGLTILFILTASIWWRYRNLMADEQALEKLESEVQQDAQPKRKTEVAEPVN
jgi:hypothetical protein